MKCLILGAGYATRLYPLTREKPKPLLPVGGVPMLTRIIRRLVSIKGLDKIYIVINHKFVNNYEGWLGNYKEKESSKPIEILDDGTDSNDTRLGAIGDIHFVLKKENIRDDLLVVAGDNLFDFDLTPFIKFARKNKSSAIGIKDIKDKKFVSLYSTCQLNEKSVVVDFEEKPQFPKTTLISIAIYFFLKKHLGLFKEYVDAGNNLDAPGYYIAWLYKRIPLLGFIFGGRWFDIGDIDSYNKANSEFENSETA